MKSRPDNCEGSVSTAKRCPVGRMKEEEWPINPICGIKGCTVCCDDAVSNRFDPYEALEEILELSPLAGVRRNVERLRAYITGTERAF